MLKNLNKMLTIFSCPKPFRGRIEIIQRNAIKSWTLLNPRPEIILIGDDEGTAEICKEFGLRHIPEVERNEHGTPLVKSVFEKGQKLANYPIVCYLNSDIIVLSDFIKTIQKIRKILESKPFLLFGGRWNIDNIDVINFNEPTWEFELRSYVKTKGWQDKKIAMDYFIFPKNIRWEIPSFALGRQSWDSWFPYKARKMKIPVIDGSELITIIHPKHDYSHFHNKEQFLLLTPEGRRNFKLLGFGRRYTIADATYKLTSDGLKNQRSYFRFLFERLKEIELWLVYYLKGIFHPYSYPLYITLKGIKYCLKTVVNFLRLPIDLFTKKK